MSIEQLMILFSFAAILITWLIAIFNGFRSSFPEGVAVFLLGTIGVLLMLYHGKTQSLQSSCKHHMFSIVAVLGMGFIWAALK
ncbi:hypothetical protein SOPP22_15890 [Shewanella sp. OPT22]|nr:hypothetical protein SOPP22_15890 [Shewanella sp. OPT22]